MKPYSIVLLILVLTVLNVKGQERDYYYGIELNTGMSTEDNLPFWFTANDFGKIPNANFALTTISLGKNFSATKNVDFAFKGAVTGFIATKNDALVNELYASLKYHNFQLDIGSKNEEVIFEGLSSSNGDFVKSTNARAIPGINFKTRGFLELPFAKKWLKFKASYGEYLMNDHRFVDNTHIHHKSLHFKYKLSNQLDLVTGLNHYVQWGGTSPTMGKQPSGFKDYLKVITGSAGGSNATAGDQLNVIGNHLGSYLVQLNYQGKQTDWSFYISHPFEDGSGREWANYPDGIFGLYLDLKQPKNIFSHILVEYTNSKHMSGSNAPDDADRGRGLDNYFNNSTYNSGWTYFGQVLGTPFMIPKPTDENGVTKGVLVGMNRLKAFHIGTKGIVKNIPYSLKLSHTTYFGWFNNEFEKKPQIFSSYLETDVSSLFNHKIQFNVGAAIDAGNTIKTNMGCFIKITKKGIF